MEENHNAPPKEEVVDFTSFDPTKKKKKKKVVLPVEESVDDLSLSKTNIVNDENVDPQVEAVLGEGAADVQNYVYEDLLNRVFINLRENNPRLAGERRRTVLRPPQLLREGTKKTVFVNFMESCKAMHRQPEHLMTFILAECGTTGSLDGQQRLVVKGRFNPRNFEVLQRSYMNEYVICNGCKSLETRLSKENRLLFLRCEECGSSRSVAPISHGFNVQMGRRNA